MDFRILGPLEVRANGDRLALGGLKQRALLATLLLSANRVVSRDRLIDDLWGESPPPTASHTLDAYVSRLRKTLSGDGNGTAPLATRPPGYMLRTAPGELDLEIFERLAASGRRALAAGEPDLAAVKLREAEALWRGRPLADLEFEPFARAHVERLDQLRVAAVEDRVDAELALGRHERLIEELQALVAEHPLRERPRAQLMLALYRSDRQADALDAYREGRVLLGEELGLDPSPRLRELERAILRHDPTLDAPAPAPPPEQIIPPRMTWAYRRPLAAAAFVLVAVASIVAVVGRPFGSSSGAGARIEGNAVAAIDVGRRSASAAIALRARPAAAASGAGSIWVTAPDAGAVVRIDPASAAVRQTIAVGGGPNGVSVGAGAVWVTNHRAGTVARIDPATERVVQTIRVGSGPDAVAVDSRFVWVANTLGSSMSRIAPTSGAVVDTIPIGVRPSALAIGAGAVWVASESANRVLRLDPGTGKVLQAVPVGTGPSAISVAAGAVWVANTLDGTISRIDTRRNAVSDTIAVGNGPSDLAVANGALWVSNELSGTLSEIDPSRRRSVGTLRLGGRPLALAPAGGRLFAAVGAEAASHRGGTLTVLNQAPEFDSLDPAVLFSMSPAWLLGFTNDGLVTFNRVGSSAGLQVVPDLAVSLPTPTDGGTAYRFQLRPGIRYSTGRPVEARDFRYAIERVFRLHSLYAHVYSGIVGGPACMERPKRCDLSDGIVADETARTVTIRLRQPDPDFLQKLALPYTSAVPDGSAPQIARRKPLPATGPYMIASYRPGEELKLVRNPRFREWSKAAQPDGYPDVIVWRLGVRLNDALTAIERGRADWVLNFGPLPADRRREILTRYASQAHANLVPGTEHYFMNTRVPPFDDVRVRRALNYALDRRALARIHDARPSCHVVPPELPGYSRYCPYTMRPAASGAWRGPDLARARRLVAASGTEGMRVRVVGGHGSPDLPLIVRLLRQLGYRASPWVVPESRYAKTIGDSRNRVQIGGGGWGADYPAASFFFDTKFSCRLFRAAPPNNSESEFCDRGIEAKAERARRRALTDPHAATRLWESVYRDIVDQAPWLPTVSPQWTDFVSKRVGNYQSHPLWGVLVSQLWVR